MSRPPHYGVIYDAVTLAPRRVIAPSDPGAESLFDGTHKAEPGEVYCTVAREHVEHLIPDLGEMAREAIRRHCGSEPPTMAEVHERKL
jgi:hypothetical protein